MKIAIIEWNDACSYETRHELDHDYTPKKCVTVGFLISNTDKQIVVSRGIEVDDKLTEGALVIPKDWAISINELEGPEILKNIKEEKDVC
jgi:hypothetical protein